MVTSAQQAPPTSIGSRRKRMGKIICQQCRTREVTAGRYMCGECEDQMVGRRPKPPKSESPRSGNGASSAYTRCGKCGATLDSEDSFCPSCGLARPNGASGRPSSAQVPPREDQTYQDPLFLNGAYRCPKCNTVLEAGIRRCAACGVMFMNPVPQAKASARASAPSPSACPQCQAPLDPNDEFCAACGSTRSRTASPPNTSSGASAPSPTWQPKAQPPRATLSQS